MKYLRNDYNNSEAKRSALRDMVCKAVTKNNNKINK